MTGYEQSQLEYEGKVELVKEAEKFLGEAMEDMKESVKAQHEIDKANFEKVKQESKERHQAAISHKPMDIQAKVAVDIAAVKEKTAASIEKFKK